MTRSKIPPVTSIAPRPNPEHRRAYVNPGHFRAHVSALLASLETIFDEVSRLNELAARNGGDRLLALQWRDLAREIFLVRKKLEGIPDGGYTDEERDDGKER